MAWDTAERGPGHVEGRSAVAADDGGNVRRPRNALVLEQLDAQRVEFDLDLTAVISNDLTR